MKLLDFYVKLIKSLQMEVKNDIVHIDDEDPLTIGEIPVALPTNNIISKMLNPDGTKYYIIFNPILEQVYSTKKNSNVVLQNLITMGKLNLNVSLTYLAKLMMGGTELKQCSINVTNFIKLLNEEVNNPAIKKIVDDKTIATIALILKDAVENGCEPIRINLNRNEKVNNNKFGRVCVVHSPLLDYIAEEEEKYGVNKLDVVRGQKTRPKDVAVLKAILKYLLLFEGNEKEKKIGSNTNQPGLDAFLNIYVLYANWFNTLAEDLKAVDLDISQEAKIELQLTEEDLSKIESLETEASLYPDEGTTHVTHNATIPQAGGTREALLNRFKENAATVPVQQTTLVNQHQNAHVPQVQNNVGELTEYQKIKMQLNGTVPSTAVIHPIPSLRGYTGLRADLHVANIYNDAPEYIRPLDTYTGGGASRLTQSTTGLQPQQQGVFKSIEQRELEARQSQAYFHPFLAR